MSENKTIDNSSNSKRIAKNTIILYARMLLMMVVNLYTSRVILKALGVEDYGIYNVVGGVVAMFSILSGSLSTAISRFITFELGKGDIERLKKVFCTAINVQLILILIVVVLLETVGLWFLNYKMVIPIERLAAANWVFQFSVITFAVNLWSVPYNATIIAHEKMSAFAYIGIFEAIALLLVAFVIIHNPIDRLVYYSFLVLLIGLIQRGIYQWYCWNHFKEANYHLIYDKTITKEIFSFAGWNFIGASSAVLRDQGGNILINLFFGPSVNAARGVATTVNTAVSRLLQNFTMALNPQITKNYANNNREYYLKLIFWGSRFVSYLMLFLCLPIILETHFLLKIWLTIIPENAVIFTQLILVYTMVEAISYPMMNLMLATGDIKAYQILVGGCQMLNLPVSYILLKFGAPAQSVFVVSIVIAASCMFLRLYMLKQMVNFPSLQFLKDVFLNIIFVALFSLIIPLFIRCVFCESVTRTIMVCFAALVCTILSVAFVGCNKEERIRFVSIIKTHLNKRISNE